MIKVINKINMIDWRAAKPLLSFNLGVFQVSYQKMFDYIHISVETNAIIINFFRLLRSNLIYRTQLFSQKSEL